MYPAPPISFKGTVLINQEKITYTFLYFMGEQGEQGEHAMPSNTIRRTPIAFCSPYMGVRTPFRVDIYTAQQHDVA